VSGIVNAVPAQKPQSSAGQIGSEPVPTLPWYTYITARAQPLTPEEFGESLFARSDGVNRAPEGVARTELARIPTTPGGRS